MVRVKLSKFANNLLMLPNSEVQVLLVEQGIILLESLRMNDQLNEMLTLEPIVSQISDASLKMEHSADFWNLIWINCAKKTGPFGTDSIKAMIKTGKMTVYDKNDDGKTLLIFAASTGAYALAQFLINNVECDILL